MTKPKEEENIDVIGGTFDDEDATSKSFNAYGKKAYFKVVKSFLGGEGTRRVLDAGCSIGVWGRFFKHAVPCGYLAGADISAERLKQAEGKGYDLLLNKNIAELKQSDFGNARFNCIISSDVFVHILETKQRKQCLKAIHDLLFDGVFVVSFANKAYKDDAAYCRYDGLGEAQTLLNDAGFTIEETRGVAFGFRRWPALLPLFDWLFSRWLSRFGRVMWFKCRKATK